ncbi:MAG: GNAT family N-acetyltransferase [Phycisphaerae bacterium]|nr:GNAT family N-acetyltransferase [Phycisphaerae bacterium]
MAINLRPAAPADLPLILDLIRELAEYEREPDAVDATEALLHTHLFSERPSAECIIAELHSTPQGFALFFHNFSTWRGRPGLYLEDLFVRPQARGKGIGKAMLIHLAQLAVERGCARMEWSVLDWNEPALAFYRTLGAKPMTEWTTWRLTGDALSRLARAE